MPFTLKDFPESARQINVGNDFAIMPVYLKFPATRDLSSFQEIINNQKRVMKSSRNFFTALGVYYSMKYLVSLIRIPMVYKPLYLGANYTTALSTVPGPKVGWVFEGLKVKELFYMVPGVGGLACGISAITHGDNV
jgi:hypothetical protein